MTDESRDPAASLGSGAKCRPIGAYVHTPTYDDLLAEIDRLRLTAAEREAIRNAADAYAVRGAADGRESVNAATLRGLLERTK